MTPTAERSSTHRRKKLALTSNMMAQEEAHRLRPPHGLRPTHGLRPPPSVPFYIGLATLKVSPAPAEAFCTCPHEEEGKAYHGSYKGPPPSHWCWLCFKKKDPEKCCKIWGNSVLAWEKVSHDPERGHKGNKWKKRLLGEISPSQDGPCSNKKQKAFVLPFPAPPTLVMAMAMRRLHNLTNLLEEIDEEKEEQNDFNMERVQKSHIQEASALQLASQAAVGKGLQTELKKQIQKLGLLGNRWPKNREDWTEEDKRSALLFDALQLDVVATRKCSTFHTFAHPMQTPKKKVVALLPAAMSKGEHSDLLVALDLQVDQRKRSPVPDIQMLEVGS